MLRDVEAIEVLRNLSFAHSEKATARELILRHYYNGGVRLDALKEYEELRRKIDEEVRLCTLQARLEWIQKHGKPHQLDTDQTIPPNLNLSPPLYFA